MTNVRKQKSGDQLAPGDWLAPGEILDGAAEVLFAHSYPAFADRSRDNDGEHVQLVLREQGAVRTHADVVAGAALFDLASDEDLAKLREAAERAKFVAGLREFAAWVEANPWAPIKRDSGYLQTARIQIDLHAVGEDAGVAAVGRVRAIADRLGVKVDESLDDRTDASATIGSVSYSVIAWHRAGRPVEPAPVPSGAVADGREGPWFEVGDRVTFHGWEKSQYFRAGLNVVGTVVETKPIAGSNPARQQFRAEGADWCGGGSMWNHSDSYELAPVADSASAE